MLIKIKFSWTWKPNLAFSGTSDPYVKFKLGGKEVFRSRTVHKNLNPVWDEKTTLMLDSLSEPLYVKVRTPTSGSGTSTLTSPLRQLSLSCRCLIMTLVSKTTSWVQLFFTCRLWSSTGVSAAGGGRPSLTGSSLLSLNVSRSLWGQLPCLSYSHMTSLGMSGCSIPEYKTLYMKQKQNICQQDKKQMFGWKS